MSISVVHLPVPHPATLSVERLLVQCEWGRQRTSGPGGQHRNKVETGVWIHHVPTQFEAQAGERRSAEENRKIAIGRLRLLLATYVRCPVLVGEIRSDLWLTRCPDGGSGRIVCSVSHEDYARLLAEAMDVIYAAEFDMKRASLRLGCSQSQLTKLVKNHPATFQFLNQERVARNLHPMK